MADDFDEDDLDEILGSNDATKQKPETPKVEPPKESDTPLKTETAEVPAKTEEKVIEKPAKPNLTGRKVFKVEKEIDWGDDNPTDLLTDSQTPKVKITPAERKQSSGGINLGDLLGIGGEIESPAVNRPPTGERRPEPKNFLKPTLRTTDEGDSESLSGRGYQPSLGGSSRGRRGGGGASTPGSVKFSGDGLLDSQSVRSGKKNRLAANSSKEFDAMSDILGLSGKEPNSADISSWLQGEEEKPGTENTDWMNLARRGSVSSERPKTTGVATGGDSTPKQAGSASESRPKTAAPSSEPLFGDEIPLDQILNMKPSVVKRDASSPSHLFSVESSTRDPKVTEHYETPKTVASTKESYLDVPNRASKTGGLRSEDGLSLASGPGSYASRESLLDIANDDLPPKNLTGGRRKPSVALNKLFWDSPSTPVSANQQMAPNVTEISVGNVQTASKSENNFTMSRHANAASLAAFEEEKQMLVQKYEQKIKHLIELHKDEVERAKEEKDALGKHYKSLLDIMEKDRLEVMARYDRSAQDMELRHQQSLESLRLLQEKNFQEAKAEFEKKVDFVRKQKDMEVEAIKSASSHLQSVNVVVEQVENQARLISEISTSLGTKSSSTLDAREYQIRAKENELKIHEERLERQLGDTERERKKIQELITKMEMHMRETTTSLENDKFTLMQDQAKLTAERKNLQLQQQLQMDKISEEKSWLDKAKADFQREQKETRAMLYEERRLVGIERAKLDASVKSYSERERQESVKNAQAEAEIGGSLRAIANEHETLAKTAAQLKMDKETFEKERNAFEQERKRIEVERKLLDETKFEVRSRQSQLDHLSADANKIRDEGLNAMSKATAIELEHNHRTQQIKTQLTALRAQEQSLAQERLLLAQEQKNLEAKKNMLVCSKCSGPVNSSALHPQPGVTSHQKLVLGGSEMDGSSAPDMYGGYINAFSGSVTADSGFNTPADFTAQLNSVQSVELLKQMLQMDYDLENLRTSAESEDQYLLEEEEYLHSLRSSRNPEFVTSSPAYW